MKFFTNNSYSAFGQYKVLDAPYWDETGSLSYRRMQ